MKPLYEITEDIVALLDSSFCEDTGEASEEFENNRALFSNKAQHVVAYLLNREAEAGMIREAIKKMEARAKSAERRAEFLRGYLLENMRRIGATKIEAADCSFVATRYPERDESVEIDEGATFPPELCNDPKPPTPSKSKIKAAIIAGEPVKGARIVKRDRLTIK